MIQTAGGKYEDYEQGFEESRVAFIKWAKRDGVAGECPAHCFKVAQDSMGKGYSGYTFTMLCAEALMPTVDMIMSKDSEEEKAAAQPSFEYLTIPQDAEEYSDHSAQDYLTKSGGEETEEDYRDRLWNPLLRMAASKATSRLLLVAGERTCEYFEKNNRAGGDDGALGARRATRSAISQRTALLVVARRKTTTCE
ncbi:hypothetical protein EG327_009077 [Venturia inaequalis]|uniref:Uncharacterized protein n=1 Tax=Venturia inaequalis TaxID=5025 RepID=A0A8H3VP44_VENIN|nr:hypothetical protein EG327_009077 [Venturia inaequalis]